MMLHWHRIQNTDNLTLENTIKYLSSEMPNGEREGKRAGCHFLTLESIPRQGKSLALGHGV